MTSTLSNKKNGTTKIHLIYLVLLAIFIVVGYMIITEKDQTIVEQEKIQLKMQVRIDEMLETIFDNDEQKRIIQISIDERNKKIDSLKRKLSKRIRPNVRSIPYDERNRTIELLATQE